MSRKSKRDWVAFDVETERLHYEVRGGWDNPAGFGFTVGATVDCDGTERVFSTDKCADAREELVRVLLDEYERIVSFNGLKFDNLVLAAGNDIVQAELDEKTWDMKRLIDVELGIDPRTEGHIVSLDNLARATVNERKSLADGREAVYLWRKGEFAKVRAYNLQDARMTARLFEFGLRNGYVLFEPARVPIVFHPWSPKEHNEGGLIVVKVKASWKR